jgi:hypothetical protein
LSNLADLAADDGDLAAARALYDRAIKAEPGNAQARLNRAVLHLLAGELKEGWRDYAGRLHIANKVPKPYANGAPLHLAAWTGGSLKGVRLLVRVEQGVGDQILFAGLLPELAARAAAQGGAVIAECDPRLVDLFARSFPGCMVRPADIKTVNGSAAADYGWLKAAGGAGAAILMGTLPRYLRRTPDEFPKPHVYLKPDPDEARRWRGVFASLGPAPAIGICWRSGKQGGHRAVQYAPLAAWADFLRTLQGTLVSAQYDATAQEIAQLEAMSGRRLFVPPGLDQKNELDRAGAMLSALDGLVSAPTAVSWIGAGVGTPTFKLLYDTSWTALGKPYEPFAPACRLVAPRRRGDWADVFRQARELLAAL